MAASREILLQINSHDRTNLDDPPTKFTVSLGKDHKISSVKAIAIKSLQCVNTFYNITKNNNTWYYDTGGAETSISIPPGQYNTTTFIAAVKAAFLLEGITTFITVQKFTERFRITFSPSVSVFRKRSNGELNPIHRVFGIRSGVGGATTPSPAYEAEAIRDLSGLKSIYVVSKICAGGNCITSRNGGSRMALLDVLPVRVPFGGIIHHEDKSFETDLLSFDRVLQNNLSSIDISLVDSENNILDSNGSDVVIVLKIFY